MVSSCPAAIAGGMTVSPSSAKIATARTVLRLPSVPSLPPANFQQRVVGMMAGRFQNTVVKNRAMPQHRRQLLPRDAGSRGRHRLDLPEGTMKLTRRSFVGG